MAHVPDTCFECAHSHIVHLQCHCTSALYDVPLVAFPVSETRPSSRLTGDGRGIPLNESTAR
jgi:hypothetical protein